jgi:hypothetical protein
MTNKLMCSNWRCNWTGTSDTVLRATNPFIEGDEILACPKCKDHETVRVCCDEPNCKKEATCGTPSATGYRNVCGLHYRAIKDELPCNPSSPS